MQYKGYEIQYTSSEILIRDSSGAYVGSVETDSEAYDFIDSLESREYIESPKRKADTARKYYIYRIHRLDRDIASNYQYFTRRGYKYGFDTSVILYTRDRALELIRSRNQTDLTYCYHMSKLK